MGIKLSSQSQTRILLFVVFTIGTIVSIASGSLYLIYNDSHEQIQSLNAVYQENNSSIGLSKAIELVALVDTPIPNKIGSSTIKIPEISTPESIRKESKKKLPKIENIRKIDIKEQAVTTNENTPDNFAVLMRIYSEQNAIPAVLPKNWNNSDWPDTSIHNNYSPQNIKMVDNKHILWADIEGKAISIEIPILNVKSEVRDLEIVEFDGYRKYESPNNFVGRIPADGAPENSISAWYFGHLESPIKGEGNVFHDLPSVPDMIRDGEKVYIILENEDSKYVYKAISTEVVKAEKLRLHDAGKSFIFLVTCVNRPTYDQRLVVKADIVGIIE